MLQIIQQLKHIQLQEAKQAQIKKVSKNTAVYH
jgi:hypothetical protein